MRDYPSLEDWHISWSDVVCMFVMLVAGLGGVSYIALYALGLL